ncbi:MAG: hypothetical protein ABI277_05620 [Burkholderiaceae bacterium]
MRGWLPPTRRARHEEDVCRGHRGLFKLIAILAAIFIAIFGAIAVAVTFGMKHGEVYETT